MEKTKKALNLEEGYVECDDCNGTGLESEELNQWGGTKWCKKCWGGGVLDWIEFVIGKGPIPISGTSGTSGTGGIVGSSGTSGTWGGSFGSSGITEKSGKVTPINKGPLIVFDEPKIIMENAA